MPDRCAGSWLSSQHSQFLHNRRFFSSHAKLRLTIQRWDTTLKVCYSLRFAFCVLRFAL